MLEKRIEDCLTDGETLLWHGKAKENDIIYCRTINMFPFIILWLAAECILLGVAVTNQILGKDFNPYYLVLTIVAILLHLIPTIIWFVGVMRENSAIGKDEYAVTDKRVIIMHSTEHDHIEYVNVSDVVEVNLRRSFAEAILDTGRIVIETDQVKLVFHSVEDGKKAFRRVYRAINPKDGMGDE